MKHIVFIFLSALPLFAAGQRQFAATISANDLKKHLYIVAGREMQGRGTATAGEQRAAGYIENHFRSLGLLPGNNGSFRQPFPVYRDSMVSASFEIDGEKFIYGSDFIVRGFSSTMLFSEAVYIPTTVPDSAIRPQHIERRLVICSDRRILNYAYKYHAAATIMITKETFSKPEMRSISLQAFRPVYFPNDFKVTKELGEKLVDKLQDSIRPQVLHKNIRLELVKHTDQVFPSNVIGYIEGSDKKDEFLVITSHYDHLGMIGDSIIYYGADDDGSGTVAILELAEAFAKAKAEGRGPRRSIVFMTVSGEEHGLWGSSYYSEHPLFPLDKTTANLNIDMIGRIDPEYKGDSLNYVYAIGEDKLSSDLLKISNAVNKKCCRIEVDRRFNDPKDPNRFYYRSDHYNFAKKGVPIIFYFNGTHADYHRRTDTPDKINYDLLEKRAKLIFYTAWEIANREYMLKRNLSLR